LHVVLAELDGGVPVEAYLRYIGFITEENVTKLSNRRLNYHLPGEAIARFHY